MSEARFIVGDTRVVTASLPDASVDLVLTSPPFLALRSYLPADHPDKALEIGSEATPAEFLDVLLDLTAEWRRVLAPHGSICVELGDTYSGSGGAGGDYNEGGLRDGQERFTGSQARSGWHRQGARAETNMNYRKDGTIAAADSPKGGSGWPLAKSLCLIPESYRWALVYGRNPFNGRECEPWRVRNVIRWCRPNPPVGALGDKVRPATSDMVIACMSGKRYFDLDAVRGNPEDVLDQRTRTTNGPKQDADRAVVLTANYSERVPSHPNGAPPLDHWWEDDVFDQDAWLIATHPYPGSHYATWPPALCEKPIKSMVPERVCLTCGEPSRRIVGDAEYHQSPNAHGSGRALDDVAARTWESGIAKGKNQSADLRDGGVVRVAPTLGWSDCGHDNWRRGIVLDPFAGSGTTLAVATGHGRDAIGVDIDERNAELAAQRIGMFLSVETFNAEASRA